MVMYVQIRSHPHGPEIHHVPNMKISFPADVIEIQADGDELLYIEKQFKNLPSTTNRVVRWKGELARFIADNLR